jgi:hypothetical protein
MEPLGTAAASASTVSELRQYGNEALAQNASFAASPRRFSNRHA